MIYPVHCFIPICEKDGRIIGSMAGNLDKHIKSGGYVIQIGDDITEHDGTAAFIKNGKLVRKEYIREELENESTMFA